MKDYGKILPGIVLALAGLALGARRGLYALAVDYAGLLTMHPLTIVVWVLNLAALLIAGIAALTMSRATGYEPCFAPSRIRALGQVLAASGIAATALLFQPPMTNYLGTAWKVLGYLAPLGLVAAACQELLGKKPFFILQLGAGLFMAAHVIIHYRGWSSDPQLQNYFAPMVGAMCLMFFAYYTAAFAADMGKRRPYLFFGLLAAYFLITDLPRTQYTVLYLGGIAWVLTGLSSLLPARQEEQQ